MDLIHVFARAYQPAIEPRFRAKRCQPIREAHEANTSNKSFRDTTATPSRNGTELIPARFSSEFRALFDQDLLRAHLKLMNYEFNLEIHEAHEMNTSERSF